MSSTEFKYLKDPVDEIIELYQRYPDGGEKGWFAYCTSLKNFVAWDVTTESWEENKSTSVANKVDKEDIVQVPGDDEEKILSQAGATILYGGKEDVSNKKQIINDSETEYPSSKAVKNALAGKVSSHSPAFTGNPTGLTKASVGLSNVNNTSDENKPVSLLTRLELEKLIPKSAIKSVPGPSLTDIMNQKGVRDFVNNKVATLEAANSALAESIEAVASGSPKGSFANEAALILANPDHTYTYVTVDTGKWYFYSPTLTAWTIGGDYQAALDVANELGTSESKVINQKTASYSFLNNFSKYCTNLTAFLVSVNTYKIASAIITLDVEVDDTIADAADIRLYGVFNEAINPESTLALKDFTHTADVNYFVILSRVSGVNTGIVRLSGQSSNGLIKATAIVNLDAIPYGFHFFQNDTTYSAKLTFKKFSEALVEKADLDAEIESRLQGDSDLSDRINEIIEAAPGHEVVEGVAESVNGYYKSYGDGAFVANSLYKSKKVAIVTGEIYYATSDVSGGATALAVYYNGATKLGIEFIGVNLPGSIPYVRQLLTLPANTTHIGLTRFGSEYAVLERKVFQPQNAANVEEYLLGYDKNQNTGKKILWLGTSIPAQGISTNNSYPHLVGNALNMTVYNESLGSSVVRATRYNGSLKGMYYIPALYSLSQTIAEKQSILDHWSTGLDVDGNIVEGGTYGWKDLLIGTPPANYTTLNTAEYILATSYEAKLVAKYLDTEDENFVGSPDIFVFDHGFNDLNPTTVYDDTLANAIAVPSPYNSRSRFCGAMNYLIDVILTYNPRAKIVFIGHYENDRHTWVYQAQEVIAAYRNFPILKLWNMSGFNQKSITTTGFWSNATTWNNSGGTPTSRTMTQIWMYDDLHPASLPTREHLANLLIGFFKTL